MRLFIVLTLLFLSSAASYAQEITGDWNGALDVQGTQLRIVFHIAKDENGYQATMDSPDQGAKGIPVSSTTFEDMTLTLTVESIGLTYEGKLESETLISGSFKQGGIQLPLDLSREKIVPKGKNRPQEPVEPFPYYSEEVTFKSKKAGITLAGTLTRPTKKGKYPTVILISGSGPQNRDEELMGHKPFLVLSDFLTRNGIAVLRYDERGTAESTGDFSSATTYDFSTDAEAAFKFLKKKKGVDKKQIGLIGHSEGGIVAPMVASRNDDVAFLVLLGSPGIPGDEILLLQQRVIGEASGISKEDLDKSEEINKHIFKLVRTAETTEELEKELTNFLMDSLDEISMDQKPPGMSNEEFIQMQVDQITSPWMQYFIKLDPRDALKKVSCDVLALTGEKDLQVPPNENLFEIYDAVRKGGSQSISLSILPDLNHLFQECETGLPNEYSEIEQTFSPMALEEILKWINVRIK